MNYHVAIPILIKALALGAISVEEVTAWADQKIMREDNPAAWLIDVSTINSTNAADIIHLLKRAGAAEDVDDDMFLTIIAGAFLHKRLTADQAIASLMERFCYVEWQEKGPLRQELYIIDDEWGWSPDTAIVRLEKLLLPYLPQYDALIGKIGIANGTLQ